MTTHLDTAFAGLAAIGAPLLGNKAGALIAQVTNEALPAWLSPLLGPVGAVVCLIIALRWMAGRLQKAEDKYDAREGERDSDRKALITVVEQNSQALRDFRDVLKKCGRE